MSANKLADAVARFEQGDLTGAQRLCNQILRRESGNVGARHLLGVTQLASGNPQQASVTLRQALLYAAGDAAIAENLGLAHLALQDGQAAEQLFRKLLDAGVSHGLLQMRLGLALNLQGRHREAEAALRQALEDAAGEADVYLNLSNVLTVQQRTAEALEVLALALAKWPQHRDVHYNRGVLLQRMARFEEAAGAYQAALDLDPAHIEAINNQGIVWEYLGKPEAAEACYRKVLAQQPRHVHALNNLGKVLLTQGRLDESAASCLRALEVAPEFTDALLNLAKTRAEQGAYDEALGHYQTVLTLAPDDADAHESCGMLCLGMGRFDEGWRHYQRRPQRSKALAAGVALDESLPHDLSGKRVLLVGEQGLGDQLCFLRYAPLLQQRGARLCAFIDGKMASVLQRSTCFEQIQSYGSTLPDSDFRIMVGDMPRLGAVSVANAGGDAVPGPLPLTALAARTATMRGRLTALGPPPYIGLTWRAGTAPELQVGRVDRALFKQAPLTELTRVLRRLPGTLIALQRLPHEGEVAALNRDLQRDVHDFSWANEDLEDMLALLALLQDYIGVSNTNMHLLAGVGGCARVLVPNPPDWRWMTQGAVSPWFPRFKVYRQLPDGDWACALHALADDVAHGGGL